MIGDAGGDSRSELLAGVDDYYSLKLRTFGATPAGVDWNGDAGQRLRFEQLLRVVDTRAPFSITDLGCGYGALFDYLSERYTAFTYLGVDISAAMIAAASARVSSAAPARFEHASRPSTISDYAVASGIFGVRLGNSDQAWKDYLEATLDVLDRCGRAGFAFNCLTSYSDPDKRRSDLYYCDPCALFDYCKRRFSRQVALLHDYGLYEFTMVVRKGPP